MIILQDHSFFKPVGPLIYGRIRWKNIITTYYNYLLLFKKIII